MILTPKNWKSFQHYKDRSPAWIKLHKGLLDDFEFSCLPIASRALAPLLWLLASEYEDGLIDASLDKLAFRTRMTRGEFADALSPLVQSGFFDASEPLAECKRDAIPEREKEGEREKRRILVADASKDESFLELRKVYPKRKGSDPGPPAAKLFLAAVKAGTEPQIIIEGARRFAVVESQNINTPYIPQLVKWLRDKRWLDHPSGLAAQVIDIRSSLV